MKPSAHRMVSVRGISVSYCANKSTNMGNHRNLHVGDPHLLGV